jgi:hypothetical protein
VAQARGWVFDNVVPPAGYEGKLPHAKWGRGSAEKGYQALLQGSPHLHDHALDQAAYEAALASCGAIWFEMRRIA